MTMKKFSNYFVYAMCLFTLAFSTGAYLKANASTAPGQPVDLTYAADKALPAVVHIKYLQNSKVQTVEMQSDPFEDFFGPFGFFGNPGRGGTQKRQVQTPKKEGSGSGVIISADGFIVTNNHVVEGADELTVTLNDNREFSARIIGTDKKTDLALIKIDGKNLPTLPIGDSDKLKVGEWVLAVGNPFRLNSTVTAGIVSAKARSLGANDIESFIQTDAAINSGNSGGALVNVAGELVGINAMLYSPTGAYSGYGFAIPTSIMTKVVADLKQYGTVQRALLGIRGGSLGTELEMDERTIEAQKKKAEELGVSEGVLVAEVVDGGSATGILKENDVIVGIDGTKIRKFEDLQGALAKHRPGDKIKVTVIRNKKNQDFTITLKNSQGNTKVIKESGMEILGAGFKPITDEQKRRLNLGYGLQVIGVQKGKMAEAGIAKVFILLQANNVPLKTVEDLEKVLKAATQSPDQVLYIKGVTPAGKTTFTAVDLSQD